MDSISAREVSDWAWLLKSSSWSGPPPTVTCSGSTRRRRSATAWATSLSSRSVTSTATAPRLAAGSDTWMTPGRARTSASAARRVGSVGGRPVTTAVTTGASRWASPASRAAWRDSLPGTAPTLEVIRPKTPLPTPNPAPITSNHTTSVTTGCRRPSPVTKRTMAVLLSRSGTRTASRSAAGPLPRIAAATHLPLPRTGDDETGLVGEHHRLRAVPEFQLGEDVADVRLDGVLADHQGRGDLRVGQPGRDQPQRLPLAAGEILEPGGQRRRGRPAHRQVGDHPAGDARREQGVAGGDDPDRVHQLLA